MPKTKRRVKKEDRRGKHTKASREIKRRENQRFFDSISRVIVCVECSGTDFVPTEDGDTNVCTQCGLVNSNRIIEGTTDILLDSRGSGPYKSRNYCAERILQARGLDPPFTSSQKAKINVVWSVLHDTKRDVWGNRASTFSKYRFRQILRILDKLEPGKRWKQKLEKWWQARNVIYGNDPTWETMDDYTALQLKVLFDPFAFYFNEKYKKNSPGEHNVPKMDLVYLVLLYNVSEEALQKYGWYFLSKSIVWPTKSTHKDYQRIKNVTECVNKEFVHSNKKRFVRSQSYAWFNKKKYVVPDLDYLVWMAYDSPEGRWTVNQFVEEKDPTRNVHIVLV